jgi:hypothetical protein
VKTGALEFSFQGFRYSKFAADIIVEDSNGVQKFVTKITLLTKIVIGLTLPVSDFLTDCAIIPELFIKTDQFLFKYE